ncbi:O-antigen ligase family protein [Vibrio sp. S4M6]|uniref:O-antigen ligase family protein n=1 Tax=Vibrio sinus TaxID=2946865 RepID=UPI00202A27DF|nr:O-antigen ligase family protein [Vibrio sinus]MCL9781304.1 O-antigen ligase family protein [Vibrio sinus]
MYIRRTSIVMWMMVVSCLSTDVAIGAVKVWELMVILLFPFFMKEIRKSSLKLFLVLAILYFESLIVTYYSVDVFYNYSFLKSKYFISTSRFLELIFCAFLIDLLHNFFSTKDEYDFIPMLRSFLNKNVILLILILFVFFLDVVLKTHFVSYGSSHRLKGLYVEGGPFGLYISCLFLFELYFFKRKAILVFFLILLLLTQSKASYVFCALGIAYIIFVRVKQLNGFIDFRNKIRFCFFIIFVALFSVFAIFIFAKNYIKDGDNMKPYISSHMNDNSAVMGRVAASYIGVNMIKEHPLVGVGLGNYSLVRNSQPYRGFFPIVKGWDLTGLGGVFTLQVENGLFGVVLFLGWVISYFSLKKDSLIFVILFLFPMLLGAQLYMVYPWFFAGLYGLYKADKEKVL